MNKLLKKAFTLVELLVVIAIVGILSGLIIVGMNNSVQSASMAKAQVFSSSLRDSLLMDLVAEWKLDGNTSNSWNTLYSGTWSGGGGSNTTAYYKSANECVFGQCLNFDGTDDSVSIASLPNQTIHGPSTIDAWFKAVSATTTYIFTDNCSEWGIYLSGGHIYGKAYSPINGGVVSLNTWHNAIVTHEHPTGLTNMVITFYLDGVKKGQATRTITTENGYYDPPFYLGDDACTAGTFFTGDIDNVRYYDAAPASSLIREHYYAGLNSLLSKKEIDNNNYQQRIAELDIKTASN